MVCPFFLHGYKHLNSLSYNCVYKFHVFFFFGFVFRYFQTNSVSTVRISPVFQCCSRYVVGKWSTSSRNNFSACSSSSSMLLWCLCSTVEVYRVLISRFHWSLFLLLILSYCLWNRMFTLHGCLNTVSFFMQLHSFSSEQFFFHRSRLVVDAIARESAVRF